MLVIFRVWTMKFATTNSTKTILNFLNRTSVHIKMLLDGFSSFLSVCFTQKKNYSISKKTPFKWTMFHLGILTALIACIIDIVIDQISVHKYSFLKKGKVCQTCCWMWCLLKCRDLQRLTTMCSMEICTYLMYITRCSVRFRLRSDPFWCHTLRLVRFGLKF